MAFVITHVFEIIAFLAGITSALIILRRDARYLGNRLMAAGTALTGIYTFGIFLYDIIAAEWAVEIFLRMSMISIQVAALVIFFTMKVMVKSTAWFRSKEWGIYGGIVLVNAIFLCVYDFIEYGEAFVGNINVEFNMLVLAPTILIVLYFMIWSMISLYIHGLTKTTGLHRRKMAIFLLGIAINVCAAFVNIASNLTDSAYVGVILDVTNLIMISIGVVVITVGFLLKSEKILPDT